MTEGAGGGDGCGGGVCMVGLGGGADVVSGNRSQACGL